MVSQFSLAQARLQRFSIRGERKNAISTFQQETDEQGIPRV
jgi:hypothetical protein